MSEQSGDKKKVSERRAKERRTGELNEKFQYAVSIGFFLDMRKGDRRKPIEETISLN